MTSVLESKTISESDRLAFYGALFAMAGADGSIDREESNLILQSINRDSLSKETKAELDRYAESPPSLEACLEKLSDADKKIQWNLMFYLMEIALVDKAIARGEKQVIQLAQAEFGINSKQVQAIEEFVKSVKEIGTGKLNEKQISKISTNAIENLQKQGVPVPPPFSLNIAESIEGAEAYYSDEKLWKKVGKFASDAGKNTIEQVLTLYYTLEQPHIPTKVKATIYGTLGYFILPLDVAPDFMPAIGFGDDAALLVAALTTTMMHITPEAREAAKVKVRTLFGGKS